MFVSSPQVRDVLASLRISGKAAICCGLREVIDGVPTGFDLVPVPLSFLEGGGGVEVGGPRASVWCGRSTMFGVVALRMT
jgi:hypothetical protein